MQTRRDFVRTVSLVAGAMLLPAREVLARLAEGTLKVAKLRDNVWLITEGGGNALLLATNEGPALVDTKVGGTAFDLRDAVRSTAAAPSLVINTHHHGDHIGGNFVFSGTAQIVANEKLEPRIAGTLDDRIRPAMLAAAKELTDGGRMQKAYALEQRARSLTAADFAPTRTFARELDLEHGGIEMRLRHFGPGHTDNDVVVHLPALNIVHAGDLIFHRLHPFIDRDAKANTRGWQRSLGGIRPMCNEETIVVPGHGKLTNFRGINEQHVYFQKTRHAVAEARKAGKTKEEIMDLEVAGFEGYGFARLRGRALGAIFDELEAEE